MKVFQYVIIIHPTQKEKEDGKASEILIPITTVLAPDQNGAALLAGRAIPENYLDKLNRIEVAVRPF